VKSLIILILPIFLFSAKIEILKNNSEYIKVIYENTTTLSVEYIHVNKITSIFVRKFKGPYQKIWSSKEYNSEAYKDKSIMYGFKIEDSIISDFEISKEDYEALRKRVGII
jgi:hypothetical protein